MFALFELASWEVHSICSVAEKTEDLITAQVLLRLMSSPRCSLGCKKPHHPVTKIDRDFVLDPTQSLLKECVFWFLFSSTDLQSINMGLFLRHVPKNPLL